jgi:hypothetical protein
MVAKYEYKCDTCDMVQQTEYYKEAPFAEYHLTHSGGTPCDGMFYRVYKVPLDIKIGGKK